jgi:hypothetical protein
MPPFHRNILIFLLVRCHLCFIWPPVLPLNLTYILIVLSQLSKLTCPVQTFHIPSTKSHVHFPELTSFIQGIRPIPRLFVTLRNKLIFQCEGFVIPTPNPQAGDHPLSAVHDCLFNTFAATFHIRRPSPPSATRGRALPWWQGTHITQWPESTSDRRLSAKLVPNFTDRGFHVVSVTDPYGRNFGLLDRRHT